MAKDLKYSTLLDIYGGMLTDKQREMIELYYNDDLSLSEIADNCGISRQGVRDAIKRGEESLDELEEKVGVTRIMKEYSEKLDFVAASCDEIIHDCKTYTTTKSVIEKLERIKSVINS
ncbi:MAG: DNA-binding protein [Oscillospiraceae bacterium]|nr:DNA-binding protein [Oscillospiraceae bacterium]